MKPDLKIYQIRYVSIKRKYNEFSLCNLEQSTDNPIEKFDVKNDVKNDVKMDVKNGVKNDVKNEIKNDVKNYVKNEVKNWDSFLRHFLRTFLSLRSLNNLYSVVHWIS